VGERNKSSDPDEATKKLNAKSGIVPGFAFFDFTLWYSPPGVTKFPLQIIHQLMVLVLVLIILLPIFESDSFLIGLWMITTIKILGSFKRGKLFKGQKDMIQVAIISDIHGNVTALEEVLKDIRKRGITQIFCLGDLVDFAPWGNEVIELIQQNGIPCLMGNHDQRIAFNEPVIPLPHHNNIETAHRIAAINLSKKHITDDNKNWLASLPYNFELTYKIGKIKRKILLVHAGIDSNDEYIYEPDQKEMILENMRERSIDVLVMGHTHLSYIQAYPNRLLVNCGSVGRSREQHRMATYGIVMLDEEKSNAEIIKVEYDIQNVATAIYNSDIPDFYGDFLFPQQTKTLH